MKALAALLAAAPSVDEQPDLAAFWPRWLEACRRWPDPLDRALAAGFAADRLGWAFVAGYQAALRRLDPSIADGDAAALCVTEASGHPRDIKARLSIPDRGPARLSGDKRFVTLADRAAVLLVAASAGERDGRPVIRLVRVAADAPEVTITPGPALPFAPEVPHGAARFAGAPAEPLPGDGYTDYIKPFRTLEDLHVTAAVGAFALRTGRAVGWPRPLLARLAHLLAGAGAIAAADPKDPAAHLALDGHLRCLRSLLDEAAPHRASAAPPEAERWERDLPLLTIAEGARRARAERAWQAFSGSM